MAMSLLALALLATVGVATLVSIDRAATSVRMVEHTFHVISSLHDYNAGMRAAESAARGYRLTTSPAMRDEFHRHEDRVGRQLEDLSTLVADNPLQVARLRQLKDLTSQRLSFSRRLIEDAALGNATPGTLTAGARLMARIDVVQQGMLDAEQALLAQRRAQSATQARLLVAFIAGGTLLSLLTLGFLLRGLQREVQRSRQLERETRTAAGALEHSLAELAQVSEQRGALARYASLLQSCQDLEEAFRVTGKVVAELIPGIGGRCYLLRASQDLAESAIAFGVPVVPSEDVMQPAQCWALRRGRPYLVADIGNGIACDHVQAGHAAAHGWSLCVPLSAQGSALGLLHVNGGPDQDPKQAQLLVESIAEQLGLALVNLQLRESLRMQSLRDPLTGLFNRRYLDESLQREVSRCQRRGLPLAVLMIDVDHFKSFNDGNGHAAGDALLAAIAQALQANVRAEDLACRYGGEEFTAVLVEATPEDARLRAEQIRKAIAATTVQHLRHTLGPCTASIGLAMLSPDALTPSALLERADAALYRAKAQGRDRVVDATVVAA
jgi:diguanylate cyclase (GGDEF)-like protein